MAGLPLSDEGLLGASPDNTVWISGRFRTGMPLLSKQFGRRCEHKRISGKCLVGFTKTSAEGFFTRIQRAAVKRLVDVRLHNVSQLAGFAKRDDLRYFLKAICGIEYVHRPELAPTDGMLDEYKKQGGPWPLYETRFLELIASRHIETTLPPEALDGACLLCSEDKPHHSCASRPS